MIKESCYYFFNSQGTYLFCFINSYFINDSSPIFLNVNFGKKLYILRRDDQIEYKLTEKGIFFRNTLVNRGLIVLQESINSIVKQKTVSVKKTLLEDKNELIKDFLMEFSEEVSETVNNETLIEQQKILERLLKKAF